MEDRGLLRWFIHNPIAANLLMILLLVGGILAIPGTDKQFFPTPEISMVSVSMPFPGAGPKEVEEQISSRIEDAIHDLNGIKEIRSTSRQDLGSVMIEAIADYPMQRLTSDIKTRVDAINTFPVDAERPTVTEITYKHLMAVVKLAGDLDERELKELGEVLRDDLARQPWVSLVDLKTPRPYEVSINVAEVNLRRFGLTMTDVVNAVRGASLNLPAGAIKDVDGDIRVQTFGQAYQRRDFEQIILLTTRDGAEVRIVDVAEITDGFQDIDIENTFNGSTALTMNVFVSAHPDVLQTSRVVHEWVERQSVNLPSSVELVVWRDMSKEFRGRVSTLLKNGIGGLALVSLVLVLFLRPMLAFWVSSGIAVAFLGTLFLLPYTGVSLNMVSLFAFLLVLGIVVDDAIIVGEAIHSEHERGRLGESAALTGVRSVYKPVLYAVISTMVFFTPMLMLPGDWATAAVSIPAVVLLALFFSLVESLLILPAHLAHMKPEKPSKYSFLRRLEKGRKSCASWLEYLADNGYRPLLALVLRHHLLVIALFGVAFAMSIALYGGGWLRTGFFPKVNSDYVLATIDMPEGGAFSESQIVRDRLEIIADELKVEWNGKPEFADKPAIGSISASAEGNQVTVAIQSLSDAVDTATLAREFREAAGPLPEAKEVRMDFTIQDPGKPISLILASRNPSDLEKIVPSVRAALLAYPGVFDVSDSFDSPRDEILLELKPAAESLGISLAEVARQVRQAFYGAEAQRIPRDREDVKVMVRYPEEERRSLASLNSMYIRAPGGVEVPFEAVAEYRIEPGYQKLERLDRMRTLEVSADVVPFEADPRAVVEAIVKNDFPGWQAEYPGLSLKLDGELQEEAEFAQAMLKYMSLSMLVIYALMAVAFRSYWQPLLVLTAVPFGIMGAIFGHAILDWQVSIFSMMGVIACAGVVVNDNLVLIDRINTLRDRGYAGLEALVQGAQDRFRPIILTSVTTFIGLIPIMSETSVQAQFLIPMVTSLAFGVLFATFVTLFLVPALYLLADDVGAFWLRIFPKTPDQNLIGDS